MNRDDVMRATLDHKERVGVLLVEVIAELSRRAVVHDRSKFDPEEFDAFVEATPRLKSLTYGSPEYKASLASIQPALVHHNAANSHHPEHYPEGIGGMTLLDLIEMICDWKAATERHADGNIERSLDYNKGRFGIRDQLSRILYNTALELGFMGQTAPPAAPSAPEAAPPDPPAPGPPPPGSAP